MKNVLYFIGIILLFTGCLKNDPPEQSCTYDPCNGKAPTSEIQALKDTLASLGITNAIQHCSGLFYIVDDPGEGKAPDACSFVTVRYKGTFPDGTVFSETKDNQVFTQYLSGLIRGWLNGIPLIKTDGRIRLFIPPSLGYGPEPVGCDPQNPTDCDIPGNSILFFEVELVAVQ